LNLSTFYQTSLIRTFHDALLLGNSGNSLDKNDFLKQDNGEKQLYCKKVVSEFSKRVPIVIAVYWIHQGTDLPPFIFLIPAERNRRHDSCQNPPIVYLCAKNASANQKLEQIEMAMPLSPSISPHFC